MLAHTGHVVLASVLAAVAGCCLLPTSASAALISGTAIGSPTSPANLSAAGTLDWAYWDVRSGTAVATMAATNDKSGGASTISDATPVNSTGVRGSTTITGVSFSFDDGTSIASSAGRTVVGAFTSQIGTTLGRGVQVAVTLPDNTQLYKVSLWVSGYMATGRLTATLPGATDFTDTTFSYVGGTKPAKLYELNVMANQPSDMLNLSYATSAANDGNSHVLIAGVAISAVPEPTSLASLATVSILALRCRRTA